ncbi:xanthine dehydrogenase family protein subunit M [Halolamina sp.]|jgi:carbon-monoxide dehydrogenase medium subunit|uniref:FAD binding domain-containing protein n=1 Tax=Halolamina sp. TaxID=1940283 RepID=UPI000223BEA8|nr:Carbon-monoxide dehydrogenase (acceptor) [halophilic archaeon DL31]
MFPPQFDYRRPENLEEALEAVAADDAVALAGGHDLVPKLKQRETNPGTVVDLAGLDGLRGVGSGQNEVEVGALTTYAAMLDTAPKGVDALLDATGEVGDTQIRNRGTVGGNLAAAHPASDIPAAALALDATLHLTGPGGVRSLPTEAFYGDDGETVCGDDELLTELTVPQAAGDGSAYARKTHPSTGYAAVGVAARLCLDSMGISEARVAVTGLLDSPARLESVERALVGAGATDEEFSEATARAGEAFDESGVRSDHLVSADQRLRLLPVYAEKAISQALDRAVDRTGVSA